MENTGTFNSDLLVIFAACFFTPIFISSLFNIYTKFKDIGEGKRQESWWDRHDLFAFPKTTNHVTRTPINYTKTDNRQPKKRDRNRDVGKPETRHLKNQVKKSKATTKDKAWLEIQQKAMEQAMQGHAGAREWVTKNVYNKPKSSSKKSQASKKQASKIQTSTNNQVNDDAVSALVHLGFKKSEAESRINNLTSSRSYASVDDLIKDSIQG